MAETLVIRLPEDDSSTAQCVLVDASGAPLGEISSGPLDAAAGLSEGRRVIGLVPASHVLRTRADIPLRNKAKIQQALPFALEEQIAADVDGQHFAFGGRDADGKIPVAVVATDTVSEWLARLGAAGIKPDALFAESDALTAIPATITVLVDGTRAIIRDAEGNATVTDPGSLQAVLELMLDDGADDHVAAPVSVEDEIVADAIANDEAAPVIADASSTPVHIVVYCSEQDYESSAMLWDMLRLRVDSLDVKILPDGALPRLASHIATQAGVNLLQGRYAPKRELPIDLQQWRVPGILCAALLVVLLLRAGLDLWQLGREEAELDAAAGQLLTATFPDVTQVSDPWAQLRSRLGDVETSGGGPAATGFADALAALASATGAADGIRIEALGYRDGNLDLQLVAPSVDKLEQLRKGITTDGRLNAEIQSANPDGNTIKGRMKVSPVNDGEVAR